ncbi:MAG: PilN domain-containing protein [Terriglobia bacterium]|nr:PilN domain-containing protein [Terriglobia bacterium]
MRLNINLATQPYEDVRKFLAKWGLLTLVLAAATAMLVFMAVRNWRDSRTINAQIADMHQKMDALDKTRAAAIATLNEPGNKVIAEKSRFLNDAIQRKSLSWTRIFMDLERMMPQGLHVVSIKPEFAKDNRLGIHLTVGGNSHEKAIELVRRMEESSTFRQATLLSETMTSSGSDPVMFEITSTYTPSRVADEFPSQKTPEAVAKSEGAR